MNCEQVHDHIVDLARGVVMDETTQRRVREHADGCPACRSRLRAQQALSAGLAALKTAAAEATPAVDPGADLLESFRAQAAHRRRRRRRYQPAWARLAAAIVLSVGTLAVWRLMESPPPPDFIRLEGFVPLPAAATLPGFERGEIVRVDVPVPSLPAYGIAIPPDAANAFITADLLIGQDGLPRAIRLVTQERTDSRSMP
jgi:hypothetical protein